jgi:hypothetical protein
MKRECLLCKVDLAIKRTLRVDMVVELRSVGQDTEVFKLALPSKHPRFSPMFRFSKKTGIVSRKVTEPRRVRGPVVIGFEQLEVRELLSPGVSLTIIPTETRPLLVMPRPYVTTFDPEAERAVTVSLIPRREPEEAGGPSGLGPLGRRFRFRF